MPFFARSPSVLIRAAILSSIVAFGCKPQVPTSETASLDNVTRGAGTALEVNREFGEKPMAKADFERLRSSGQIKVSDALAETLRRSLANIEPILDVYFNAGYKIEVSDGAAAACKIAAAEEQAQAGFDATETDQSHQFIACWSRRFYVEKAGKLERVSMADAREESATQEEFVINLDANDLTIRHAALRLVGFSLFQRLSRLTAVDGKLVIGAESAAFRALRASLGVDLLQAVAGKAGALAPVRHLLPSDPGSWKRADVVNLWATWREQQPTKAALFDEYAAAESFDSYYHSAKTKAAMERDFPVIFKKFDEQIDAELSAMTGTSKGFGLQDEAPSFDLCGRGLFPGMGCGGGVSQRQQRFGGFFPRFQGTGCGFFIRRNC